MSIEKIYNEFSPKIFRICLGYFNDVEMAKDLTQETFISVIENYKSFKNDSNISTWIFRIATNKCLRQIENNNRKNSLNQQFTIEYDEINIEIEKEEKLFLRKCLAELPELERLVIGLYLEDLSQKKISEVVGLSHENVRVKVHRIKEQLIKKFKENGKFR